MSSGFAVIVKIVFKNNMPKPMQVTQEVWDTIVDKMKAVDWSSIAISGLFFVAAALIVYASGGVAALTEFFEYLSALLSSFVMNKM